MSYQAIPAQFFQAVWNVPIQIGDGDLIAVGNKAVVTFGYKQHLAKMTLGLDKNIPTQMTPLIVWPEVVKYGIAKVMQFLTHCKSVFLFSSRPTIFTDPCDEFAYASEFPLC